MNCENFAVTKGQQAPTACPAVSGKQSVRLDPVHTASRKRNLSAGQITIQISTDYFHLFETQGFFPDAANSANNGRFVSFTFDEPRSDNFRLDYDAYIQPMAQIGRRSHLKVITDGQERVGLRWRTFLFP